MDPTCVLCMDCFQNGEHRKHRYRVSVDEYWLSFISFTNLTNPSYNATWWPLKRDCFLITYKKYPVRNH